MHEPQYGWHRDRGGKYGEKSRTWRRRHSGLMRKGSGAWARVTKSMWRGKAWGERHRENVSMWKMSKCLPRSSVKDIWHEISWTVGVWRGRWGRGGCQPLLLSSTLCPVHPLLITAPFYCTAAKISHRSPENHQKIALVTYRHPRKLNSLLRACFFLILPPKTM